MSLRGQLLTSIVYVGWPPCLILEQAVRLLPGISGVVMASRHLENSGKEATQTKQSLQIAFEAKSLSPEFQPPAASSAQILCAVALKLYPE